MFASDSSRYGSAELLAVVGMVRAAIARQRGPNHPARRWIGLEASRYPASSSRSAHRLAPMQFTFRKLRFLHHLRVMSMRSSFSCLGRSRHPRRSSHASWSSLQPRRSPHGVRQGACGKAVWHLPGRIWADEL